MDGFARAAKIMFDFFCKIERELNIHLDEMIVGGGFGVGIHNVLEAAVWDMPVIFGPNNERFR